MKCDSYNNISPENSNCAWCEKFKVNIDRTGRFCDRCHTEPSFKKILQTQYVARFGSDCQNTGSYCEIFDTATTEEQCEKCKTDPLYRAFLRGQAEIKTINPKETELPECENRKEIIAHETRKCCGGKTKSIEIYRCLINERTHAGLCHECKLKSKLTPDNESER